MKLILDKHTLTGPTIVPFYFETIETIYYELISKETLPSVSAFAIAYGKIAFWQKRKLAGRGLERLPIG